MCPNRLTNETSPYLKQHEDNPVDWYPWAKEALEKAKNEDKPIILSVGYSACHWCHVMAHESFENPEIAKLMNENFINIKVDREERPDLDHIYQNVAQAMTRGGGWPLTVFLTPDLKPFFGGTYFPPEDRYGRPGFPRVLTSLSQAYQHDRASILENAEKLMNVIIEMEKIDKHNIQSIETEYSHTISFEALQKNAEKLLSWLDWNHGGFGQAPKFPNTMLLTYIWRLGRKKDIPQEMRESLLSGVLLTLTKMSQGGIFDQLGGGFHRYSVDETWSVPHFEKMLYDNALLLQLYSEVLLTQKWEGHDLVPEKTRLLFLETIQKTVGWLKREMQAPDGGFYAAQDADSLDEHGHSEEGAYFVWSLEDLKILTDEQAKSFAQRYGVTDAGNFEKQKTVLFQDLEVADVASKQALQEAEYLLLNKREKRAKPQTDTKVLIAWNALMIRGLVWASQALKTKDQELSQWSKTKAQETYDYLLKNAWDSQNKKMASTIQEGKPKFDAYLDDYAFMASAALELTRLDDQNYYSDAKVFAQKVLDHFSDKNDPGYFFTSDDHEQLIQRPKTIHDQAIPSGTAIVIQVLQFLADPAFENEWRQQLNRLLPLVTSNPYGFGEVLCASLLAHVGAATLEGKNSRDLPWFPYAIIKSNEGSEQLICQKQTCQKLSSSLESYFLEL